MIFPIYCLFRASPGPIAGAPLKSPMVSVTVPNPLFPVQTPVTALAAHTLFTDPTPEAKLMRLNRLNTSARSWILTRSVIGMFLMNDRSTSLKPGPVNLLRARSSVVPGQADPPGEQNASGFHHWTPGMLELKL